MLIQSIKLENIRSYNFQEINFPEGSVLLSGDIGSGKSTILSAIEFALFGIKRGDLSGNALLRHGKKEGSVELRMMIGSKEVIIKRSLKRGKDDIKQDTGYIIIDGLKTEATAVELKTKILELLGFPQELVSKGKDLIYRYTVYTPQEQMKEILTGDPESRLDALRRVFGIDRYKRIRENALIISKLLREKIKLYQGQTEDLEDKQTTKKERKEEIKDIEDKLKQLHNPLKEIKEKIVIKKSEIIKIEKNIHDLNSLKKDAGIIDANLKNMTSQLERNNSEISRITKEIETISSEIKSKENIDTEFIKKDITIRKENIIKIEKQIKDLNKSITLLEAKKISSEELKQKISKIDQCPTCLQEVSNEHKMFISQHEDEIIINADEQIKNITSQKESLEKELELQNLGLEKIRKKESELSVNQVKLLHIQEKTKSCERLKKENEQFEKEISSLKIKISEIKINIESLKDSEIIYLSLKKEHDLLVSDEKNLEISYAELSREKQTIEKILTVLDEEINRKTETKEKLNDLKEKDNWLNKQFINLTATIEKHVMLKIHQEFSDLFKEWFNIMIEDESITARLDDSFTPVVEQDGYETEFINMSGGERTSLALAYRLSLNKVINDLIETIKIKDLIILDEPTDGFSTEQLDRVKIVLDQLNLNQIIIVSHESKIEGFVDTVIKVSKEDGISRVS